MRILIKITKGILKESMFCTTNDKVGQNCAIGKAIHQLFGDYSWVGRIYIRFGKEGMTSDYTKYDVKIELPDIAKEFIIKFDICTPEQRIQMEPIQFEIDVPEEVIEWISLKQVYKVLSESKSMELVMI